MMTQKRIVLESTSDPGQPGYLDRVLVYGEDEVLYQGPASCCPNPTKPWPRNNITWETCYGWIATGTYAWECVSHWRRGRCLLVNDGGICTARRPNPNHEGLSILTGVYVHKGWSNTWRGSAGCITVPPEDWSAFVAGFSVGETGLMDVVRVDGLGQPKACRRADYCPIYRG